MPVDDVLSDDQKTFIHSLQDATGQVDPQELVNAAQDPHNVLHDHPWWGGWDVNTAATKHWLDTSKRMIKIIKLEIRVERRTVISPYYVSKPPEMRTGRRSEFVALTHARLEREHAQFIINAEVERLLRSAERLKSIAAVLEMTDQIQQLSDCIDQFATVWAARQAPQSPRTGPTAPSRGPGRPRGRPPRGPVPPRRGPGRPAVRATPT